MSEYLAAERLTVEDLTDIWKTTYALVLEHSLDNNTYNLSRETLIKEAVELAHLATSVATKG